MQPLLANHRPEALLGVRGPSRVAVPAFIAAARSLAAQLPPAECALLLCADRLAFATGFAALLIRRIAAVLPPSHAPLALARIVAARAPAFALVDRLGAAPGVREITVDRAPPAQEAGDVPLIADDQIAAIVYTSGTTGEPQPHVKRWGSLVRGAVALRARIGFQPGDAVVGAVPPQHMWGLEATVMLPLQGGGIVHAGVPLLPEDIAAALAQVAERRWLVATPLHLRSCARASVALPKLHATLTATSALDRTLAADFSQRHGAPVIEIYGSTETGAIATRRPADESAFAPLEGIEVDPGEHGFVIRGGHLDEPIALADRVTMQADGRFALAGRDADLVKIGGKRASLAMLEHELRSIPGVADGGFVLLDDRGPTPRLAALAVAPGMHVSAIVDALRARIDAVFLPRPLHLVDALPRDPMGKLPAGAMRETIAALAAARERAARFVVPSTHPALAGHFPGRPIVPAAWLMTLVADACQQAFGTAIVVTGIANARFRAPLSPGVPLRIEIDAVADGRAAFRCLAGETRVADGVLTIGERRP